MVGLSQEVVAGWLDASCAAQGVPKAVTDPAVLAQVVTLLGAAPGATTRNAERPRAARARQSQAPDGLHTLGVEFTGTVGTRQDDGVVEDGRDDGCLLREGEPFPLSA